MRILKDDGCSTNIISSEFLDEKKPVLYLRKANICLNQCEKDSLEATSEKIVDTEISIVGQKYRSSWAVPNTLYDVLFRIPWHEEKNPNTGYTEKKVEVGQEVLPN